MKKRTNLSPEKIRQKDVAAMRELRGNAMPLLQPQTKKNRDLALNNDDINQLNYDNAQYDGYPSYTDP